jgi:hypothetical protein
MDEPDFRISAPVPRGAFIETAYVERAVRAYAVYEHEVDSISRLNGLSSIFFSLSASLVSIAAGVWVNAAFVDKLGAEGRILCWVIAPALCLFSVIFSGLGYWAVRSRRTVWGDIKQQSVQKLPST